MLRSRLFSQSGFVALYLVQFCGALNDNLFRAALLTLIAFAIMGQPQQAAMLNNLAMALFILPMILISPLAGQLSDRADKPAMVRHNKWFELAISCLALIALASMSLPLLLLTLTLLGLQSALFGPNKYALIPQLLPGQLLTQGNASVASGTFIAISLGTLLGTWMASGPGPYWGIGLIMLLISAMGLFGAYRLPPVARGDHDLQLDGNLFRAALRGMALARSEPHLRSSIAGLSWFWFFGTGFVTQLPTWSRFVMGSQANSLGLMFTALVLGLLGGALAAAQSSRRHLETGLILPALWGLILAGSLFALLPLMPGSNAGSASISLLALMALMGFLGALYLVPLYALLQQHSSLKQRARIIAANNLVNSLCMVASIGLGFVLFGLLQQDLVLYFLLLALSGLALLPRLSGHCQASWRLVAAVASRVLYRLSIEGRENIPPSGPVVFVCNHLSYADSVILFGAIERGTRFIMEEKYWRIPLFNPVLRSAGTIPICSPLRDRRTFEAALHEAAETLTRGQAVFIFPEGRLSPDGSTIAFKRGVERILERQPASLVPVAIEGLWGSWFSHGGGKPALTGWPRPSRRKVRVKFGEPLAGDSIDASRMRNAVLQLMQDAPGS